MTLHIVFSIIFVISLIMLVIIGIKVIRTGRNMTPHQVIRKFEKLEKEMRAR